MEPVPPAVILAPDRTKGNKAAQSHLCCVSMCLPCQISLREASCRDNSQFGEVQSFRYYVIAKVWRRPPVKPQPPCLMNMNLLRRLSQSGEKRAVSDRK